MEYLEWTEVGVVTHIVATDGEEVVRLRAENERLREEMHHMIVRNQFLADNYGLIYSRQDQAKEALK